MPALTRTEQITHELAASIVSGVLAPGEFLPREIELAARYQVSRPTIRNALKSLAGMGLTLSRRGSGHKVRDWWNSASPAVLEGALNQLDLRSPGARTLIHDLLEARAEHWWTTVRLACGQRDERRLVEAARLIDGVRDPRTMVMAEIAVFERYTSAHANLLLRMQGASLDRALQALCQRLQPVPADPDTYANELRRIHRAIEMALTDDAGQMTRSHLAGLDMDLRRAMI